MKVMVIVKASKDSEAGVLPSVDLLTEMGKFNEELVKAGIMLSGEGLQPSSKGFRVHFSGKNRTVIDGPFSETKELVAGFWVWQVKSMAEALEWVKRCPNPMLEDSDIEVRPFYELADFGDNATSEVREREERLRTEIERHQLEPPRFEQRQAMRIAGYSENFNAATRSGIPDLWLKFAAHIGSTPGQQGKNAYGLCCNCGDDGKFDYLAGVEVSDGAKLPADFTVVQVPAARYAVFTHSKHYHEIPNAIEAIWSKWLPNSGHQAAPTPAFEQYTEEFNPETGMGGTEIWLPLQS